jgi:predicted dienelactone hydrolase
MMRFLFIPVILFFFAQNAWCMGDKTGEYMVGFTTLGVTTGQGSELSGEIAVWYPSDRLKRAQYGIQAGPWLVRAEMNVPPAKGLFPLILVSHDTASHALAQHDLCSALAGAGFVVAAPTHYADNSKDANAVFSAALYYHRPRQLRAVLDSLAKDKKFGRMINFEQIGALGSGAGALTVLQLAGADIDPASCADYCRAVPADGVFCNKWAYSRLLRLPADMQSIRAGYGANAFAPRLDNLKAVGLLAPGGLFLLDKSGLADLAPPLAVLFAEQDELYKPEIFPAPLAQTATHVLKNLDHYSVNAVCPEEIFFLLPESCGAAPQDIRAKAAKERDRFFVTFFQSALAGS